MPQAIWLMRRNRLKRILQKTWHSPCSGVFKLLERFIKSRRDCPGLTVVGTTKSSNFCPKRANKLGKALTGRSNMSVLKVFRWHAPGYDFFEMILQLLNRVSGLKRINSSLVLICELPWYQTNVLQLEKFIMRMKILMQQLCKSWRFWKDIAQNLRVRASFIFV